MNFIKMGKQEVNICIWELINGIEDDDTWVCFKRLKRPKSFVISLYKKTCKLNALNIDENIVQKISSFLNDVVPPVSAPMLVTDSVGNVLDGNVGIPVTSTMDQPKMISRKRA